MSSQSPSIPTVRADKSERKAPRVALDRAAWIQAGTRSLAALGVEGVRIETLAKECGVTKGSFYWHFRDRNDLLAAVLEVWREGRIRDIGKQTHTEPGKEVIQLHHVIDIYAATRNRKGMAIELAVRDWARRDEAASAVVAEVDAIRLESTRKLFLAAGLSEVEASSRSVLLYAYVFGFSLMNCERFAADISNLKTLIKDRITL